MNTSGTIDMGVFKKNEHNSEISWNEQRTNDEGWTNRELNKTVARKKDWIGHVAGGEALMNNIYFNEEFNLRPGGRS
jgi:hypothetical protein